MNFLLKIIRKNDHHFQKGGKLEKLHPLWEAQNTFLFTPGTTTKNGPHIRDSVDMKRYMITVVVSLIPAILMGMYNAGYQSARAYDAVSELTHWQHFANGAIIVLPIIFISYLVGGIWEIIFAVVRRHPINEGFLVTGILFPLTLPPTIPYWQVAIGITFGVVIGKEIFGGTGMNVLNPALTGRVFLFFSYPAAISGDKVWVNLDQSLLPYQFTSKQIVDAYSGATALATQGLAPAGSDAISALASTGYHDFSLWNLTLGMIPGSIGETSTIAIAMGAILLIVTGIGSWRIIFSTIAGALAMGYFLNATADESLPAMMNLPSVYHLVLGGFMFGAVFMATDPVSASATDTGKYIYGFMIGILTILVRVWNPAYPEGTMLAILFMNLFAPLIDYFVLQSNINRRLKRATAG